MSSTLGFAVLACTLIACMYVGLMYIWRGSLPRDHPSTIKRRLLSTAIACAVAWLPAYFWATRLHQTPTPVHNLLGLRLPGLPRAVVDSLYLLITLFAGPLIYFLYTFEPPNAPPPPPPSRPRTPPTSTPPAAAAAVAASADGDSDAGRTTCTAPRLEQLVRRPAVTAASCGAVGSGGAAAAGNVAAGGTTSGGGRCSSTAGHVAATGWLDGRLGDLRLWRNYVAAPLTEEFVFRACMVPLLKLEGVSNAQVVLLTPLFFSAAHLHHLAELVRHQRMPLNRALGVVFFQLLYTTLFGWLATLLFLRTGHLAAPVAAHAFCNWAGFPPLGDMAAHPRGVLLLLTTAVGAAAFGLALPRMTLPARYQQDYYS